MSPSLSQDERSASLVRSRSPRWLRRAPWAVVVALVVAAAVPLVSVEGRPRWRSVLREEFSTDAPVGAFPGEAYRSTWDAYPDGWRDTSEVGVYAPSRVLSVRDGVLDVAVRAEAGDFLGAAVVAAPTYGQLYGRYAVRWRADPVAGFGMAFLLWPDSEKWPDDGEIDFPEGRLTGTVTATAHHADPRGGKDEFPTGARMDTWHTTVVEWTPGSVLFRLDGHIVGSSTTRVPHRSMHWVMQVGTDGDHRPPADARGLVQVDWVHVDAYEGRRS